MMTKQSISIFSGAIELNSRSLENFCDFIDRLSSDDDVWKFEEYTLAEGEKIVFVHQFKGREFVISYYGEEIILFGELINDKIVKRENKYVILNSPSLIEIVQLGAYIYIHTKTEKFLRMIQMRLN